MLTNTPNTALSLLLRVPEWGHGSVVYYSPHPLHSMVPVVLGTNGGRDSYEPMET